MITDRIKKVPRPYKEEFLRQSLQLDLNILYYCSIGMFGLSALVSTAYLIDSVNGAYFTRDGARFHLFLAITSLLFLILFKAVKLKKITDFRAIQCIYSVYIVMMLYFAVKSSFLGRIDFPQAAIYTLAICLISMILNINYVFINVLIWMAYLVFARMTLDYLGSVSGMGYLLYNFFINLIITPISIVCYNNRVNRFLQNVTIQEQKDQLDGRYKKLEQTVHKDSLTGVSNRLAFDHKVQIIDRDGFGFLYDGITNISVIMMDIDYFKMYNDTYGHRMGDECLQKVAKALGSGLVRSTDEIFRYGGEEFVVFLPGANEKGAEEVVKRMLNGVQDAQIPHRSSTISDYVTVSAGIVTYSVNDNNVNVMQLVDKADRALYHAKNAGRNQYHIFVEAV